MNRPSGHIIIAATILAALQTVCGCSRIDGPVVEPTAVSGVEISLKPAAEASTKAPVEGTVMPDLYTIYLSAYISQSEKENIGDYFTEVPFTKDATSGLWRANPARYWPIASEIDLLAVACDAAEFALPGNAIYNRDNCTKGVVIDVAGILNSEIMYSSTRHQVGEYYGVGGLSFNPYVETKSTPLTDGNAGIAMEFGHTQAWLHFNLSASSDAQAFIVESLQVRDLYKGGELTIYRTNPVTSEPEADWYFGGVRTSNLDLVETETTVHAAGSLSFDCLIPEQKKREVLLTVRYLSEDAADGALSGEMIYTIAPEDSDWLKGRKYTYNIILTPTGIRSTVDVEGWAVYNHLEQDL